MLQRSRGLGSLDEETYTTSGDVVSLGDAVVLVRTTQRTQHTHNAGAACCYMAVVVVGVRCVVVT